MRQSPGGAIRQIARCGLTRKPAIQPQSQGIRRNPRNDDGDFPIARGALEVIDAFDTLDDELLGHFVESAKTTEDLSLMDGLLACVIKHGDERRQRQVVRMSRKGKRLVVSRAAASALFEHYAQLPEKTVSEITEEMVLNLPAMIANYLVLMIGFRGPPEVVNSLADKLATSGERRVFLALLAAAMRERDTACSKLIAARLPDRHPARRWAEGDDVVIERAMLIDLGDAPAVKGALLWMGPAVA